MPTTKRTLARQREIKLLAFKRYVKRVKDRERRFQAMSLSRKRVAVAKDVIEALAADKIRASHTYLMLGVNDVGQTVDTEVQDIIMNQPHCTACAVGAVFICATLRNDQLSVKQFNGFGGLRNYDGPYIQGSREALFKSLKWLFPPSQLGLIESAFEMGISFAVRDGCSTQAAERAVSFGIKYTGDEDRLIAIMTNIIKHKGRFVPPKELS